MIGHRKLEAFVLELLEDPNHVSCLLKSRRGSKTIVRKTRVYFPGRFEISSLKKDLLIEPQLPQSRPSVDYFEEMEAETQTIPVLDIIITWQSMDFMDQFITIIIRVVMALQPIQLLLWTLICLPSLLPNTRSTEFLEDLDQSLINPTTMMVSTSLIPFLICKDFCKESGNKSLRAWIFDLNDDDYDESL